MIKKIEIIPHYMVGTRTTEKVISRKTLNKELDQAMVDAHNVFVTKSATIVEGEESYTIYLGV